MARKDGHLVRCEQPLGTAVSMLRGGVGPIAGVQVLLAAGWNGPGRGVLRLNEDSELSWRAPYSSSFGAGVDVSAGGTFWPADGGEPDKWICVEVTASALPGSTQYGRVELSDRHNNGVADVDTEADDSDNWTVYLKNYDAGQIDDVSAWLDSHEPANRRLTLKLGAGASGQPYSEAAGLALWPGMNIVGAGSLAMNISRVIPAGVDPAARKLVRIFFGWDDNDGGRARICLRGCYRIAGIAAYQAYRTDGSDPDVKNDAPFATNASLPWTPADDLSGDADNRFALTRKNAYGLESDPATIERIIVATGAEQDLPPAGPYKMTLTPLPSSKVRAEAMTLLPAVGSATRPTHWALWYTTDGGAPGAGDPDYTEEIKVLRGYGLLRYDGIPAQAGGATVKVLVKTRGATEYSENGKTAEWEIKSAGPGAPAGGEVKK